jgi:hypothetical protein
MEPGGKPFTACVFPRGPLRAGFPRRTLGGLLILSALAAWALSREGEIRHPPGVLAPSAPQQTIIAHPRPWKLGHRLVVPLARFTLRARVLGRERYRFDSSADLSPLDLALGWGPMSDQRVIDRLDIAQANRRFVVTSLEKNPPLPMNILMAHSANMHMIPANADVASWLLEIQPGQVIDLEGYLVGIRDDDRWTWVSSLSRTDRGDGACEVVWVEHVGVTP